MKTSFQMGVLSSSRLGVRGRDELAVPDGEARGPQVRSRDFDRVGNVLIDACAYSMTIAAV